MTRDEETLFLRFLQEASLEELSSCLSLIKRTNQKDGLTRLDFKAIYNNEEGYLWFEYEPLSKKIISAEMNVGFQSLIGLNRSPLELLFVTEHVLALLGDLPALEVS